MSALKKPLAGSRFTLNPLAFTGFIGGAEVISALATIPLYRGRRWLGWYNTPGGLDVARHLANFASSFCTRSYGSQSPTRFLGFDSKAGPNYIAAFSGGETQTGYLGYLALEWPKKMGSGTAEVMIGGRGVTPMSLAVLDFVNTDLGEPCPLYRVTDNLLALIPISTSIATCLLCASVSDWYICSMILVGMFTNGFASLVIGSGRVKLESPRRSVPEASPRRGLLISGDTVVVVRGGELTVRAITEGRFKLDGGMHWQISIWLCSLLYLAQCLSQFVVVPQGTLFGQLMFVISSGVSWGYGYRFASSKERLQAEFLFSVLGRPEVHKFHIKTRTSMAVFACLVLFEDVHHLASPTEYDRSLTALLPIASPVWRVWKDMVVKQLHDVNDMSLSHLEVNGKHQELFSEQDIGLLEDLLGDAAGAFRDYFYLRGKAPCPTRKEPECKSLPHTTYDAAQTF